MVSDGSDDPRPQPDVSTQPSKSGIRRAVGEDDSHASPSPRHSASATGAHMLTKPTLREQSGDIILEEAAPPEVPNGQRPPPLPPGLPPGIPVAPDRRQEGVVQAHISRTTNTSDWVVQGGGSRAPVGSLEAHGPASRARYSSSTIEAGEVGFSAKSYRSMLTQDNLDVVSQLEKSSGRTDAADRLTDWLHTSGPPFDSSPSVGVTQRHVGAGQVLNHGDGPVPSGSKPSASRHWCCCLWPCGD